MLVSIIIPTKNRCNLLRETLASVSAQTYDNWEAIVVDDGSNDGTGEMVLSMTVTDKRVRFLRRERTPKGASTCRNIGISAANGKYIIFLDSDDLLAPDCLEGRVKIMEENPNLDFAVFLMQIFHAVPGDSPYLWNIFTDEDDLDRLARLDGPWQTTGPLWRKSSLTRIGPWDERALSSQDWEFPIRAIAAGLSYRKIEQVDSFWRMTRPNSMTHSDSWASPLRLWNRVRLFGRIIAVLRANGLLTERRRRRFAAGYYQHAFIFTNRRNLAHKIWSLARREKIIGKFDFAAAIASDLLVRIARRAKKTFEARLFPELHLPRTYFVSLPPTKRP